MNATQIRLARRPEGEPGDDCLRDHPRRGARARATASCCCASCYLSLDPYMRGRMSAAKSYADPVEVGDVMVGGTVCQVESSRHPDYADGDCVLSYSRLADPRAQRRLRAAQARPVRRTAVDGARRARHARLHGVRRPAGDRQAAAGRDRRGRGRHRPGRVGRRPDRARSRAPGPSGIAGGPDKCRALLEEFGFDAAVDHRSPTFAEDLKAAVPDGIDVYFENVGGHVAAEVFKRHATSTPGSRCAAWSPTTTPRPRPEGPDRLPGVHGPGAAKSLTVRGFIQGEFTESHGRDFVRDMSGVGRRRLGALPRGRRRRPGERPRGVPRPARRPQLRQAPGPGRRRPDPVTRLGRSSFSRPPKAVSTGSMHAGWRVRALALVPAVGTSTSDADAQGIERADELGLLVGQVRPAVRRTGCPPHAGRRVDAVARVAIDHRDQRPVDVLEDAPRRRGARAPAARRPAPGTGRPDQPREHVHVLDGVVRGHHPAVALAVGPERPAVLPHRHRADHRAGAPTSTCPRATCCDEVLHLRELLAQVVVDRDELVAVAAGRAGSREQAGSHLDRGPLPAVRAPSARPRRARARPARPPRRTGAGRAGRSRPPSARTR